MAASSAARLDAGETTPRSPRLLPLACLLALVAVLHTGMFVLEPRVTLIEDEPHYNLYAYRDFQAGETSLMPGRLRFDQRPELISRVLAQFVVPSDLVGTTPTRARFGSELRRRIRYLNLGLLLGLMALVYLQTEALGHRPRTALGAAGLVGLFPWLGFYVHALWAEVLHAFLVGVLFLAVLLHLQRGRLLPLAIGGLALGWALLAKGTMNSFLPVLGGFLAVVGFRAAHERPLRARLARAFAAPAVLAATTFAVTGPQLLVNARDGEGWRLAGNRWKNVEMGVTLEPRELQTGVERVGRDALHDRYMAAGSRYETRESRARERVFEWVQSEGVFSVAGDQLRKLGHMIVSSPSFFERGLSERWAAPVPIWLTGLRLPARALWFTLLLFGGAGVLVLATRSAGHLLFALFVVYLAAGLFAIPYKLRFAMPAVPVLAVLAAAVVEVLLSRRASRASEPTEARSG